MRTQAKALSAVSLSIVLTVFHTIWAAPPVAADENRLTARRLVPVYSFPTVQYAGRSPVARIRERRRFCGSDVSIQYPMDFKALYLPTAPAMYNWQTCTPRGTGVRRCQNRSAPLRHFHRHTLHPKFGRYVTTVVDNKATFMTDVPGREYLTTWRVARSPMFSLHGIPRDDTVPIYRYHTRDPNHPDAYLITSNPALKGAGWRVRQTAGHGYPPDPNILEQRIVMTFAPDAATNAAKYVFAGPLTQSIDPRATTFVVLHGFGTDLSSMTRNKGGCLPKDNGLEWLLKRWSPDASDFDQVRNNVLFVDWSDLAIPDGGVLPSDQFPAMLRHVQPAGSALADHLFDLLGLEPSKTILVGYSAGALVAAVTAKATRARGQVATLISLDSPAYLLGVAPQLRPASGDAGRVIGVHSSSFNRWGTCNDSALGWYEPFGDLDLYLYSDRHTHSEGRTLLGSADWCANNDHDRSLEVFVELILNKRQRVSDKFYYLKERSGDECAFKTARRAGNQFGFNIDHLIGSAGTGITGEVTLWDSDGDPDCAD